MWYILISSSKKGEKKQRTRKPTEQEKGSTSVPVGYEQIVEMYPLDFEEFLWANNLNEEIINVLKRCLEDETPVPGGIHVAMKTLLYRYVAVGGMPAAVNALIETGNMGKVNDVWNSLLKEYRSDMVKYADDKDKPYIRACFNAIPKQLAKENKKYQWSKVESGGRGVHYKDSLQWLEDADIIRRCYNSNITGLRICRKATQKLNTTEGTIHGFDGNALFALLGLNLSMPHIKVSTPVSLAVIFGVLAFSMLLSVALTKKESASNPS